MPPNHLTNANTAAQRQRKLPGVTQWSLVCLILNPKPLVPSLCHDTEIARVGGGLIGSLMHRKGKLGWGWGARKDFREFCTGEHLDQSHRGNEARLPSNIVLPYALWLFGCYITEAYVAPITWTPTQFYLESYKGQILHT